MALRAQVSNGVKVYNLASTKSLPEWLKDSKSRKALRKNEAFVKRIDLIQDFDFPVAASAICMTPDQSHIIAAGVYAPQMRVYDTRELSLKFERHLDAGVIKIVCLSQDWKKIAMLQDDRYIELHAQAGRHTRIRIPRFGRDMALRAESAELLVPAAGGEVYRLDMEAGRFNSPLTSGSPGLTSVSVCPATGLVGVGGEDGYVELWDLRSKARAARIHALDPSSTPSSGDAPEAGCEVSSLLVDSGAMCLVAGSSGGSALLFDLRSSRPRLAVDHRSDEPVQCLRLVRPQHPGSRPQLLTADKTSVRLWSRDSGALFTSMEPGCPINDAVLVGEPSGAAAGALEAAVGGESDSARATRDSGLVLLACEQPRMVPMYVPELGPAPRWAAYLDTLTEELEEDAGAAAAAVGKEDTSAAVFQDYKFVARSDLARLGLAALEGTPLLRAYMHGYFVDRRLYQRAVAASDPEAFDRWQAAKATRQAEAEDRILLDAARPRQAVNAKLAEKLRRGAAASGAPASGSAGGAEGLAGDARFRAVFSDPAFAIDDDAAEFFDLRRSKGAGASGTKGGLGDDDSDAGDAEEEEDGAGPGRGGARPLRAGAAAVPAGRRGREEGAASLGALLRGSETARGAGKAAAVAGADDAAEGLGRVRFVEGGGRETSFVPKRSKGRRAADTGDKGRPKARTTKGKRR